MLLLNNPPIRDMGAIQPCQIPHKNPAGLSGVYLSFPGIHPDKVRAIRIARIHITKIFLFILEISPSFNRTLANKIIIPYLISNLLFILKKFPIMNQLYTQHHHAFSLLWSNYGAIISLICLLDFSRPLSLV